MIEAQDLTKQFGSFLAVDGINLSVPEGEVLALLGPNGAGKTTTVRMLTSVLRPTRGTASVAGFNVVTQAAQVRGKVGVLTEMHGLYGRMPAEEYLDFFGQVYQMPTIDRKQKIRKLLEDFGLYADRKRKIGEYSKGMRQKLALARALLHNPAVLLLDEPTSAMDPESARLVRDSIYDLRTAKRTIVLCTHNLPEAEELADKIAIIRRGQIIAEGSARSLKNRLLGDPEFELRFTNPVADLPSDLPGIIEITRRGQDWIVYKTSTPLQTNPLILQRVIEAGLPVLGLQEVNRSLEKVYLQAIGQTASERHA
jgi:ABC-2 type transport system ATP-binding protein